MIIRLYTVIPIITLPLFMLISYKLVISSSYMHDFVWGSVVVSCKGTIMHCTSLLILSIPSPCSRILILVLRDYWFTKIFISCLSEELHFQYNVMCNNIYIFWSYITYIYTWFNILLCKMARTKSTARKSTGGKIPRKQLVARMFVCAFKLINMHVTLICP